MVQSRVREFSHETWYFSIAMLAMLVITRGYLPTLMVRVTDEAGKLFGDQAPQRHDPLPFWPCLWPVVGSIATVHCRIFQILGQEKVGLSENGAAPCWTQS